MAVPRFLQYLNPAAYSGGLVGAFFLASFLIILCTMVTSVQQTAQPTKPTPESASTFQSKYFTLTVEEAIKQGPYDIIIVGSGFGGGVLAADLYETNRKIGFRAKKVLLVEKGNLVFHTHCLNTSRPSSGRTGRDQFNHHFYSKFKDEFQITEESKATWGGGPVFGVGGRGAIWSLATPRIHDKTLQAYFPKQVAAELVKEYYQKAEQVVKLFMPVTKPLHQEYIDRLNFTADGSLDVSWQWARIGSNLREENNFDFAKGAYSPIDKLLEIAMNTSSEERPNLNILLGADVQKINWIDPNHPTPKPKGIKLKSGVDINLKPGGRLVISAGSIHSAALLLRSDVKLDRGLRVTDHNILYKNMPYRHRNPADRAEIRSLKLQTYLNLLPVRVPISVSAGRSGPGSGGSVSTILDDVLPLHDVPSDSDSDSGSSSTPKELLAYKDLTLVNLYIDSAPFLSRGETFSPDDIPKFVMIFVMRTPLEESNRITLDKNGEPIVAIRRSKYQLDLYEQKKEEMKKFSQAAVKVTEDVLKVDFLPDPEPKKPYFDELDLGAGGHEMGTIPMDAPAIGSIPAKVGHVNNDLKLRDYENVYVCDLSVFPFSPEANPSLTLAALAVRLSRHLVSRKPVQAESGLISVVNHSGAMIQIAVSRHMDNGGITVDEPQSLKAGEFRSFDRDGEEALFVYKLEGDTKGFSRTPILYEARPGRVIPVL